MNSDIPALTPQQMRQVDDLMVDYYGITILQMMEHDARALTEISKQLLGGSVKDKVIVVVSGKGGNGAGGLATARHLHNAGARVSAILVSSLSQEGEQHKATLEKLDISVTEYRVGAISAAEPDLVLDALLGYMADGAPRPPYDEIINEVNSLTETGSKVLANDLPSGIDVVSGEPHERCIKATATVTLGLPKVGLLESPAREVAGELYLADIGIPPELYAKMGLEIGTRKLFEKDWIVKLPPPY